MDKIAHGADEGDQNENEKGELPAAEDVVGFGGQQDFKDFFIGRSPWVPGSGSTLQELVAGIRHLGGGSWFSSSLAEQGYNFLCYD
jgi:hypothetical protein